MWIHVIINLLGLYFFSALELYYHMFIFVIILVFLKKLLSFYHGWEVTFSFGFFIINIFLMIMITEVVVLLVLTFFFFFILGVPPLLPKILAVWDYFAWKKYRDAWRKNKKVTKVVVKSNGVVLLVANWKYIRFLIQLWKRCIEEWIHWNF